MIWIDANEHHPTNDRTVLIATDMFPRRIWLGYFSSQKHWHTADGHDRVAVSHWMSLPFPPVRKAELRGGR